VVYCIIFFISFLTFVLKSSPLFVVGATLGNSLLLYYLIRYLCEQYSTKSVVFSIVLLSFYAYIIETLSILTGFPYGYFHYNNLFGYTIFDTTPIILPVLWLPIILSVFIVVQHKLPQQKIFLSVVTTSLLALVFDFIFDPIATNMLSIWKYDCYSTVCVLNVPITNFLGWFFSGLVAALILVLTLKRKQASLNKFSFVLNFYKYQVVFWFGFIYIFLLKSFLPI
jgi:bisanhydrobacterioruberin hydratase